jgi:hypothetical protein
MSLQPRIKQIVEKALANIEGIDARCSRLIDDGRRLWGRVQQLLAMKLIPGVQDAAALELACYALQLPLRNPRPTASGKLGRTNLRERTDQAAEMLLTTLIGEVDEALLDHTAQLLHELPQRTPAVEEARVLADAVNLEDFGVAGILQQMVQLCRTGGGVAQAVEGLEKREQYGYWNARLKEGFHFEEVRDIARQRLEHTRHVTALLTQEMAEDRAS